MEILRAENVKKYYMMGENIVKALDGVSLNVERGEFVSIVGSSGSGKSTLLHILGGLDVATEGKVEISNIDISKMSSDELTIFRRRKIGFVFQNYNLVPLMNVWILCITAMIIIWQIILPLWAGRFLFVMSGSVKH